MASLYKSERREIMRRNRRKMRVSGKSVFVIRDAQRKRDQEWAQKRHSKRMIFLTQDD